VLLRRTLRVDPIPEGTKGRIELDDSFVVGEGRYSVEWRLRDSFGRHCSAEWKIEAKPKRSERNVKMTLRPGDVDDSLVYIFRPELGIADPDMGRPLRLKVFLNFDVRRRRRAARVRVWEFMPRIAVLRSLSRHPRLGQFALVVYSLDEQDVFHSHDLQSYLEFRPLRDALKGLSPATVSLEQLGRDAERDFFGEMLTREISAEDSIDAYVFVGPDGRFGEKLSRGARETLSGVEKPVFFLNTSARPWRGLVGNAVGVLDGKEYKVWDPKKLSAGVAKLVALLDEEQETP